MGPTSREALQLAMDVNTATFEHEVIEASKTLPVVVDFWAPWCGPCRSFKPLFEKVAENHPDILFAKVNTSFNLFLFHLCSNINSEKIIKKFTQLFVFKEEFSNFDSD